MSYDATIAYHPAHLLRNAIVKILIVDDHALFRAGLRLLLGRLADDVRVFEAESVESGLALGERHGDLDLILLDVNFPGSHGLDGLAGFRRRFPASAVVLLSGTDAADAAAEGRARGAQGFIAKSVSAERMLEALRRVLDGELWFPGEALARPAIYLTPRQVDVLSCLGQGRSNKEIARNLGMSENTVRTHIAGIFRALGVNSRTEAAIAARKSGFH